jgi:hypothetical protein
LPRPLLKTPQQFETEYTNILSTTTSVAQKKEISLENKMKIDRILRKSRSKGYMNAVRKLDAGGHTHNQDKVKEIIDQIRSEFPEVEISGILLGYVSKCYLGDPYEVHTLDITGNIIEHYKKGKSLPNGLEKARSIAIRGGYDFIEVYVDCCRAISNDGTVSLIGD